MALEIIKPGSDWVTPDRRLYRTEAGDIVEEGDPAARWLVAVPGKRIHRRQAEQLGLLGATAHTCAECGFEAKNAGGLAAHERSHEGEH